jgi:LemA protein
MRATLIAALMTATLSLAGCGWQKLPAQKNAVDAATAEVMNQYKRRADLVPNLVATVKGYATHERDTLTAVTEARAHATATTLDPAKATPEQVKAFQEAQAGLTQALSKLLVVVESYPELKADRAFRDLQAQLEGTENRIAVARNRLITQINDYNDLVTVPPTSWTNSLMYHYPPLPQWTVSEAERTALEQTPKVQL